MLEQQYEISSDTLLTSATASQPFDKNESLDNLSTAARDPAGLGVITEASPGVEIVRNGNRIPVEGKQALVAGDRVIVPKDGFANAVFPGRQPNEAPLSGTFTGGTDALVGVKPAALGGGEQLQIDMASGDMVVVGAEEAVKGTTLAVKKAGSAGSEGGIGWLLPLALGGLIGALASRDDGDGDNNPDTPPPPPPPPAPPPAPTPPPAPATGQGLLDPAATLTDNLTDALNGGPLGAIGLGSTLQPVDNLVNAVTNAGNGVLAPLLGDNFDPNTSNALDPVDNLAGQVTDGVGGLLSGVLDPLLGQGATDTLIAPLDNQVDFVTDGLANLLGGGANGGLLGDLLGLDGGTTPAGDGLLDPAATLVDELTDALDGGLLAGASLGGVLEPVDSLVMTVTDLGNDVLAPLLGETFTANNPNTLDPVDGLVVQVTDAAGGLLGGLLDPVLGQGAVDSLITPLDTQVDFLTDGVATLLGPDGGLLGGLLGGNAGLGGLLGGGLPLAGGSSGLDLPTSALPISSVLSPDSLLNPVTGLLGAWAPEPA